MMGACFGGGMIAGPVIGGFAGQLSVQAPFMFAAAINGLAFLVSYSFYMRPIMLIRLVTR